MFSTGGSSSELPKKSLQIKQDDKFFSRLLSKESSVADPSRRVYYGGVSGAVPFMWESRPGTPKHTFSDTAIVPPLTPPPSYQCSSNKKPIKKNSRSNLLYTLFPKISLRKTNGSPSLTSASFSSSRSSSILDTITATKLHGRKRFLSQSSSFDSTEDDEEGTVGSPTSTLCCGIGRVTNGGGLRGCYRL